MVIRTDYHLLRDKNRIRPNLHHELGFVVLGPMASRYSEKLKDPRWQKRRLDITSRDNWTCQKCGDTHEQKQVHHRHYIPGREPWDYPDDLLVTLCYKCHEEEERFAEMAEDILNSMHFWGFFNTEIIGAMNKMINERIELLKAKGQPIPVPQNDKLPF